MFVSAGICLGMQCAVIEFARNKLEWIDAHSTEAEPSTTHPVVCMNDFLLRLVKL